MVAATGADASLALAILHLLLSYGRGDLNPNKFEPELSVHSCLNLHRDDSCLNGEMQLLKHQLLLPSTSCAMLNTCRIAEC